MRETQNPNYQSAIFFFAFFTLSLLSILVVELASSKPKYSVDPTLANQKWYVQYESVNLRNSPEIPIFQDNRVMEITRGTEVVLTGNMCVDSSKERWFQVTVKNDKVETEGWLVGKSIWEELPDWLG